MSIPPEFFEIISKCELTVKRAMLEVLIKDIQGTEVTSSCSSNSNNSNCLAFDHFVSTSNAFVKDDVFMKELKVELDSLDLYSPLSAKPKSMWFNLKDDDYFHGGKNLTKYPHLSKLCTLVSSHENVNKQLDCCNIICFNNNRKTVRLHADNESCVDQSFPIATVSIGATRNIEFVPFGSHHERTVLTVKAEDNSLYVMKPGCQAILQHRVTPGNTKDGDQKRYSISFRKYKPDNPISAPIQTLDNPTNIVSKTRTSLIVGDSFAARLDSSKLSKGRKNVINLAQGRNKLRNVHDSLEKFYNDPRNANLFIDQVFVSVGTNDIRYCKLEGVHRFKGELHKLTRFIKQLYPSAKVFFQSLIPLPLTYENSAYVIKNVLDFNRLLYDVCKYERVFLLDVFGIFLLRNFRNLRLFPIGRIYPNKRGIGLLAREYISRIHSKHFNPLSFN